MPTRTRPRPRPVRAPSFVVLALAAASLALAAGADADPPRGARRPGTTLLVSDSFDVPIPSDRPPSDRLPEGLRDRQRGRLAPAPYVRRSGVWFRAPAAGLDAVNAFARGEGRALGFRGPSAVRLDAPLPMRDAVLRVSAHVDPVEDDVESLGWISLVLSPDPASAGWVAGPEVLAAVLVRSNGAIQVFSRGAERFSPWVDAPPAPAHGYDVAVAVGLRRGEGTATERLVMEGSVGGAAFRALLGEVDEAVVPTHVHLSIGAHFHEGDTPSSVVDDLRVETSRRW